MQALWWILLTSAWLGVAVIIVSYWIGRRRRKSEFERWVDSIYSVDITSITQGGMPYEKKWTLQQVLEEAQGMEVE